jgi:hypothetical protein
MCKHEVPLEFEPTTTVVMDCMDDPERHAELDRKNPMDLRTPAERLMEERHGR